MNEIKTATTEKELHAAYWAYLGTFTHDNPNKWANIRSAQAAFAERKNELN